MSLSQTRRKLFRKVLPFLGYRTGRRAFGQLVREAPLRLSFEKFHQLLDYNNRVLEIIAEMSEMLNGEYVFDKSYLNLVCEELSSLISKIAYNLNVVGEGKHLELFQMYEAIKHRIDTELEGQIWMPEGEYVVPFRYLDRQKSNLSGGKAAVLGELRKHQRILVPPGFAVTTQAYYYFMDANNLRDKIREFLIQLGREGEAIVKELARAIEQVIVDAEVPAEVAGAIEDALDELDQEWKTSEPRYAIRSSAVGEDTQLSFAGQFSSFLNVPRTEIINHYKKVIASLFSSNALSYRKQKDIIHAEMPMAVLVMPMLDPICSGITYSVDPTSYEGNDLIISAVWGLAQMVAEGEGRSDYYVVSRNKPHVAVRQSVGLKSEAFRPSSEKGIARVDIPADDQGKPCLPSATLSQLAELALRIETYFAQSQDIEWAMDRDGTVYVVQARPLLTFSESMPAEGVSQKRKPYPVLLEGKGVVACRGLGAGKAYHIFPSDTALDIPEGAVLVARTTSPRLSSLISRASAVVTDIGTPTGHMATIAREFRVPMLVDTGEATRLIRHGMEVTVDANHRIIYDGIVPGLVRTRHLLGPSFLSSPEFCKLRNILKHVAPLHLVDPHDKNAFRASACKTYHDIIRYSHEMVVKELIDMNLLRKSQSKYSARRLSYPLPIGLILIDVGGGLKAETQKGAVTVEQVNCLPLKLVLEGLLTRGMWSTQPVPLSFRDFISGVSHTTDPTLSQPEYGSRSLAIISDSYLNLSLRFGYHFTMVDCVLSEKRSANYIYFRFVGGITEMTRRKRRAEFLSKVLKSHDFNVSVKGDLVIARLGKLSLPMMEDRLLMIGRLLGFSRQLDISMKSETSVDHYAHNFLAGIVEQGENEQMG